MHHARTAPRLAALLIVATALTACQSIGTGDGPPTLDRAQSLAARGDHAAAAREYEALARDNAGVSGNPYLLAAGREWLDAQRAADASRVVALLAAPLTDVQSYSATLLRIEVSLLEGRGPQAWSQIETVGAPPPGSELAYFELRQKIAFDTARPGDGVRAQIAGEVYLKTDEARFESRRKLFAQLRDASARGVKIEPQSAAREPLVRGWLELGPIAAQAARSGGVAPALASWRARFPDHPGASLVRSEITGSSAVSQLAPGAHVAVLLPISGRAGGAAAQIRDGLLAGLYGSGDAPAATVRVYDTATMTIAEALQQAAKNGAEFVIGPLTRDEVIAAAAYEVPRPPMLALNFLPSDRTAPAEFFQFALSPEDEARGVARHALAQGQRRAIALTPEGDWGTRVAAAFREELESGGGSVLASATYTPGRSDYSGPIQGALRLADSRARHRRLESVLGTSLEFQPRRRGDIDFIFAPAQASTARQLRPQLRFHYAGDIPTYATSDVYEPSATANQDLDGLMFPDMPWMLGTTESATRLSASVRQAWGDSGPRGRLFAFGYDAWQLCSALRARTLSAGSSSLAGVTGELSIDPPRRVRRELDWAQIRGGMARPLPTRPN